MNTERRRHIRHPGRSNAFAALGKDYAKVGRIKDISMGGLAFEYMARKEENPDLSHIDIFLKEGSLRLFNLPCSVVYDIVVQVPQVDSQYVDLLTTRRCGVKFGVISASNRRKLRAFIDQRTDRPENGL